MQALLRLQTAIERGALIDTIAQPDGSLIAVLDDASVSL